jgi:xanthine dehydrogenase accessory factor
MSEVRVLVLGTTPIARAVMGVGAAVGYEMVPFSAAALDGAAAVVLASHGAPDEDPALRAALASAVPYIGLIGSRARGEGVVAALAAEGLDTGRIHTPAGLDIGAGTPEEVAVAILAQFVSLRPRVPGASRAARGAREERTCGHGGSSGSN